VSPQRVVDTAHWNVVGVSPPISDSECIPYLLLGLWGPREIAADYLACAAYRIQVIFA
jgi:hypothetical protein